MAMTLSSTTISSTSSTRRSAALNPEEQDLWELCYYAGLTTDPKVFRILMDLLRMDVHPQAVINVLKNITPKSKYNANKTSTTETVDKSTLDKTKTVKKVSSDVSTKSKAESSRGSSKSATKTHGSSKNASSASVGEKKSASSVKSLPAGSTKTKPKPSSTKSDPGRK
uniref:Mitotic-spindle organizing protein 2B-like n=1 Tax=Phallusia mammillata TaxID=59560 RepID=A0A6F9DMA6_9ASCI|nr:mitotic-spindle organizing protein 2B-like [Phallusia mammillata]